MSIEIEKLTNIVEAALLAFGQPLSVDRLMSLFSEDEQVSRQDIREALQQLQQSCESRSVELVEVGSGFRYQARKDYAKWVSKLWEEKPPRYSRALLETLVLVAYRQPITRAEIEDIRGVSVSSHIMKTLQERDWVRVVGHKDVPGKPALYATTKAFLDYFSIKSLDELPSLMEIRDLDKISAEIDRQGQEISAGQAAAGAAEPELMDSEDVERLLPDGDADHGDGFEGGMEEGVTAQVEERIEEALDAAEVFVETAGLPETQPPLEAEAADAPQQQETDMATGEDNAEFIQREFDAQAYETDIADETVVVESPDTAPHAVAAIAESTSDVEAEGAELLELAEEAGESVHQSVADSDNVTLSAHDADTEESQDTAVAFGEYDESGSVEEASGETPNATSEPADTAEVQRPEEPPSTEARFSTANYGLRAAEHDEQEHDESGYAEDEHDDHPERLPTVESNS